MMQSQFKVQYSPGFPKYYGCQIKSKDWNQALEKCRSLIDAEICLLKTLNITNMLEVLTHVLQIFHIEAEYKCSHLVKILGSFFSPFFQSLIGYNAYDVLNAFDSGAH